MPPDSNASFPSALGGSLKSELRGSCLPVYLFVAGLFGVLLVYSQTLAFAWDETYHVLAAQLIGQGKRPYLDFSFPQAPLNAYWNAAWMRILGQNWRVVHAVAAALTAGTSLITARFIYTRFPASAWRCPASSAAALLIGFHAATIEYATLGMPYPLCLFLLAAAFRMALLAAERDQWLFAAAAGALATSVAASSLLTIGAPAVLFIWILKKGKPRAWRSFLAGAAVPVLPLLWLFAQSPYAVFFNLFQYHLFYRRTNWEDATPHDWNVLKSSLTSPQALILGALSAAGMWFIARSPDWDRARRAEVYLSAWMALAVGGELCLAHPTFEWYFVLIIPFLAIPAVAGLHAISSRLIPSVAPSRVVALLFLVFSLGGALSLYRDRGTFTWTFMEAVAAKVNQVTQPHAGLWADESVYFLTHRPPAEGTECSYTEVIDLPQAKAAPLHIVSLDNLDQQASQGVYGTVETCEEQEQIEELKLARLFRHSATVGPCHVFWEPVVPAR